MNMQRLLASLLVCAMCTVSAFAQVDFESPPIDYNNRPTRDPVTLLQKKLEEGKAALKYDEQSGYLASVLEQLGIDTSSQVLVFSQTSFQLRKISPSRPRALYFNDDSYVGFCQFGDVLEVSSVDPEQGAVFYTLDQEKSEQPRFVRDRGQCLTCHASSRTQGVPGHLVRSVFADRGGVPLLGSGTFTTDHKSPFEERWGGWYVTGSHGGLRHMGNVVVTDKSRPESLDREAGANVTDLSKLFEVKPYLTTHSDIVALMVLEHQTQMHNFITRAGFETRMAEHHDQMMNEALKRPASHRSESTQRRISAAVDNLVKYMLFSEEFQLTSPVEGSSEYSKKFAKLGPHDSKGRSLREFDLNTRLFRYPCSYLIYSRAFDSLPDVVRHQVYGKLWEILTADEPEPEFAHLSDEDRTAIREILSETKSEFQKFRDAS